VVSKSGYEAKGCEFVNLEEGRSFNTPFFLIEITCWGVDNDRCAVRHVPSVGWGR